MNHRKRTLRNSVCVAIAVLAAVAVEGAAAAQPDRVPATPAAPGCVQPKTDWPRCLTMTAQLSHAPAVGQEATLTVTLTSQVAVPDVRVRLHLPDLLRWQQPPEGFTTARHDSAVPSDYGAADTATRVVEVKAGQSLTFQATVRAVAAGSTTLRLNATSGRGFAYGSGEIHVPLVVGTTRAASALGVAEGDSTGVPAPADAVVRPANPHLPYVPASPKGLPQPHSDDPDSGPSVQQVESCVTARFLYRDNNNVLHPAKNLQYQAWDEDTFGDDLLAAGLTDANGGFRACFDNDDGLGGGGQDVYVRGVTENGQWSVEDHDDDPYAFRSDVRNDLGNGRTHDFGGWLPADPVVQPAYHAYDEADDAAAWTPGDCWDARDDDCQRIDIDWEDGSTDGTYYDTGDDEVRLLGADPNTPWVVMHELGHGVMDDVYEEDYPDIEPSCQEHFVHLQEEPICAWTEGFADWYGAAVLNNPDTAGRGDIDAATWGTIGPDGRPWDNGDRVEGRIAGALWDLEDPAGEVWDNFDDTLDNIWNTFLDHRATTFREYWTQRGQDGHNVGDEALGALYQNTIDYGFRQPLADGAQLVRPAPTPQHNYRYDTRFRFWSVVAIRPPAAADYDLVLFDDRNQNQRLEESVLTAGVIDFVAVDSNVGRRELGDYYPRVQHVNGTGDYTIEVADSGTTLPGTERRTMGAGDVVAVWDACLTAGQPVTITVTPEDPSQDPQLFLMGSEAGNTTTYVRDRVSAVASSFGQGAGAAETITYTPTESGCHGVVLVNGAGAGTYTITRS